MALLDPTLFRARVETLLGRAWSAHQSILNYNRWVKLETLRQKVGKRSSGLRLGLPLVPGAPLDGVASSAVATDNHPQPPTIDNQPGVQTLIAYLDRPEHYENGVLKPQVAVMAKGSKAFELTEKRDTVAASKFVEDVRTITPYGTAEIQFKAYDPAKENTGVPDEVWKPDLSLTKTVYPLALASDDAELILRIGAVSELYKMAKLTYSAAAPSGSLTQISTSSPTYVETGDEIDLFLQITGGLTFFAQPRDGDSTMVSLKSWSGAQVNLFQLVAKTAPGADRQVTLSDNVGQQNTLWVREFKIGATLEDTVSNAFEKLQAAGGNALCDLQQYMVFVKAVNSILLIARRTSVVAGDFQSDYLSTDYQLKYSGMIIPVMKRMALYPGWWKEGATIMGQNGAVARVGRSISATKVSDTAFTFAMPEDLRLANGTAGSFPAMGWTRSRAKDADPAEQTPWILPQSTLANGSLDQPATAMNLVAALRQSNAWQRYTEKVLAGSCSLELTSINEPTLGTISGITVRHPDGVDATTTSACYRLDSLYWFVQATGVLRCSVPGVTPTGRNRHVLLRRGEELRTISATAKVRLRYTLDTPGTGEDAEDFRMRSGFIFHSTPRGYCEAGVEVFLQDDEPDYTWSGGKWNATGTRSRQKKIRAYLVVTDPQVRLQTSGQVYTEGDARVLYGWAMAAKDWSPDSGSYNFASTSSTPDEVTLALTVRDLGDDQFVAMTISRAGKKVSSTASCRMIGSKPGAFGLVAQPCAPELDANGNGNPEIQSADFTGLLVTAPTGRYSATYARGIARRLDIRTAKNCFAAIGHGSVQRRQLSKEVTLLPGEMQIGIDDDAPNPGAMLTLVGIPLAGQWIEVKVGTHRFYYQFIAATDTDLKAYSVKIPSGGAWKQRVATLSDNLFAAMSRDGNLKALAEVSRQALVASSGEAAALSLKAVQGGPRYNIRVTHLLANRVSPAATQCIASRYMDYQSDLMPEGSTTQISGDGGTSIDASTLRLSPGLIDLANPRAAYDYFDSVEA